MPTPDDYYYEPGQRPYYTPAAYRPPPRDPRDNVDPNSYVYQPVPEGPATPGTGSPGATSGRNEYHGHPTAFAQQILNGQQPSTAPPAPRQQPPTPAQAQPAFPGVTAAPPPATPPRGTWGQPEGVVPPPALTPPPDKQGNRYWNPVAPQQPFADQINRYSHEYGIPANLLSNLLRAESNFNPRATGPMTKYGQAEGIAQFIPQTAARYHINPYDPDQGIRGAAEYLRDLYNQKGSWAGAVAAYNGAKSIDVSQYRGSPEGRVLIANAVALDGGLVKAGPLVPPPQNYRPVSYTPRGGYPSMFPDRPPSQWGRDTPDMFSGLGAIPQQREIPGVLGALAPFLMIGLALFSKGAALPMLSAFGGYQNARNKRQEEDAKNLRTKYQDQLKELKAKMGIEQVAYAGAGGDQTELRRLATEFGDDPLLAILNNGGDPTALFQQRDKAFQDISKTSASNDLAERREHLAEVREDREEKYQDAMLDLAQKRGTEGEQAAADKAAKAKAARDAADKALREDRAAGFTSDQPETEKPTEDKPDETPPAESPAPAESPPPADEHSEATPAAPTAIPASAGATPTASPPASGGEDQVVDAQGNPIRQRTDVRPAAFSGAPFAAPPVGGAPTETPAAAPAASPDPNAPIPTPGIVPGSAADGEVSSLMTGGAVSDIPKRNQQEALTAAAWRRAKLNDLARLSPASGEEFNKQIARLDPGVAELIDRIAHNDAGIPSQGMGGRLQAYDQMLQKLAMKQNPRWDPSMWKSKQDLRDDFMKGWRSRTIYRANNIPGAAANVLTALNKVQAKYPNDTDFGSHLDAALAHATGTYKEYAGLAAALRQFAMESTSTVSMGQPAVTLVNNLLQNAMPVGENPAAIREAVKIDIGNISKGLDTLKGEWAHNFHDDMDSAGYVPENDHVLKTIEQSLDSDSGQFLDQNGKPVGDLPELLQPAVPQVAPAPPGTHTDKGGWSITPVH